METETHSQEKVKAEKKYTDISLVAYLVSQNFKMLKIKKDRDKSIFFFMDTQALEEETLKYFNHEAKIDPLKFSETLRNLRSYAKQH
jgi:hypothetical protein